MLTELDFVVFDTDVPIWPTLPYFLMLQYSRSKINGVMISEKKSVIIRAACCLQALVKLVICS